MPTTHVSSLPEPWVEKIWAAMRGTYGAEFDRQWECPAGADPQQHVADLKAVWGRGLAGFQQNPKAIGHGLDHLPDRPPNLVQFAALCRSVPVMAPPALEAPKADPARVAAAFERMRTVQSDNPKAWASRLRDREEAGERLSITQKAMWRAALRTTAEADGEDSDEPSSGGQFTPASNSALPPGMRDGKLTEVDKSRPQP